MMSGTDFGGFAFEREASLLEDALRKPVQNVGGRRISPLIGGLKTQASEATQKSSMAPQLAYGRHRGPTSVQVRHAAVLIAIYAHPELGWVTPLTLRPRHLEHHPGQICFPGGGVEEGEDHLMAARREFTEELGVSLNQARILGELSPIYVYASRHQVRPFVGMMSRPAVDWLPDPREVEKVIEFPLRAVKCADAKTRVRRSASFQPRLNPAEPRLKETVDGTLGSQDMSVSFDAPCYHHAGHEIWGATAMILHELAAVLPEFFYRGSSQ